MKQLVLIFLLLAFSPVHTQAATWYVEQDGSGQFYSIQTAVNASASGDTIRIGPGRYTRYREIEDYNNYPACVHWTEDKSLTFIGTSADQVFVGPDSYSQTPSGSVGFWYRGSETETQTFRSLTITQCHFAVRSNSNMIFTKCRFSENYHGIRGDNNPTTTITNCVFEDDQQLNSGAGVDVDATESLTLQHCTFNMSKFRLSGNCNVSLCEFNGQAGYMYRMTGAFSHNTIQVRNYATGLGIFDRSNVRVENNVFQGGETSLGVAGRSDVQIFGNVFSETIDPTIVVSGYASLAGSGNHILHGEHQYTVSLFNYVPPSTARIDLRNNYWGTTDLDLIDSWMLNSWLTPVEFLPIADGPMPTERKNWGSVKAMYR